MSDRLHGLRAPAPTDQHQRADKLSTNGDTTFSRRVERGSRRMREPHREVESSVEGYKPAYPMQAVLNRIHSTAFSSLQMPPYGPMALDEK